MENDNIAKMLSKIRCYTSYVMWVNLSDVKFQNMLTIMIAISNCNVTINNPSNK